MATLGGSSAAAPPSPGHRSPWNSPVPYLFGGLAAMMGLIAFALLILACSYWKLSGRLENQDDNGGSAEMDLEAGVADGGAKAAPAAVEEKYLVIMAGQDKPTFLATPISSRASSFSSKSSVSTSSSDNMVSSQEEYGLEKVERNVDSRSNNILVFNFV